jgi:hypothetical protein
MLHLAENHENPGHRVQESGLGVGGMGEPWIHEQCWLAGWQHKCQTPNPPADKQL